MADTNTTPGALTSPLPTSRLGRSLPCSWQPESGAWSWGILTTLAEANESIKSALE
jgi:hypothetical protein